MSITVWLYRETLRPNLDARSLVGYDVEATDGHIAKANEASTETSRNSSSPVRSQ